MVFAASFNAVLSKSNKIPLSNFTIIPSPSRITSALGIAFWISAACLSILRPINAPAVPPIAPPIKAPTAVLPAFLPIKAPITPPAAAPIPAPFCVLVKLSQLWNAIEPTANPILNVAILTFEILIII
ncbi:hypothetical protein D3C73_1315910 [compost metagenome]